MTEEQAAQLIQLQQDSFNQLVDAVHRLDSVLVALEWSYRLLALVAFFVVVSALRRHT